MSVFKNLKLPWIIHIFAILHALVAFSCRLAHFEDELLLTILTIAMSLIICYKKNVSIEFTAAVIIVGNIIGYLMGTLGANIFEIFFSSPFVVHALSTAVTTEVLGWSITAITKILRTDSTAKDAHPMTSSYMKWILLAAGGIFVIRLAITGFISYGRIDTSSMLEMTGEILSNTIGIIVLACINIIYVRFSSRLKLKRLPKFFVLVGFMVIATTIETGIVSFGLPFENGTHFEASLPVMVAVSFLAQLTLYCIVYIINYAVSARAEMHMEREKANMAQYRYLKLKRQVNPHFLFNSLNILDCLVCEEKTEQASTYLHKLAGIYRYMIKSEEEDLVPLRDELVFVNLYVDLIKVRFPEGFNVIINVPEEQMARFVLPCSLQLLIENATKHNAVSPDNPLTIRIETEGNNMTVSNNIIPKVTASPSTGLGQKYIRQQYLDLSGKEIGIRKTEDAYCVTLPLL